MGIADDSRHGDGTKRFRGDRAVVLSERTPRSGLRSLATALAITALVVVPSATALGDGGEGQVADEPPPPELGVELARLERERAQRRTPEARAERVASRTTYRDQTPAEALATAKRWHHMIAEPLWRPVDPPGGGRIARYLSDRSALIDNGEGEHRTLVESLLPLRTRTAEGEPVPVDLSLADRGGHYEPAHPLAALTLPGSLSDGIALPDIGLRITPAGGPEASRAELVAGKLYWANLEADTDFFAAPLPGGVETGAVLRSAESPERIRLRLDLPEGARLDPPPEGRAIEVVREGESLAEIGEPVAWDADGESVPASYAIEGSDLVITVKHRAGDYLYPVLLDPPVIENYQHWRYNGSLDANGWNVESCLAGGTFDNALLTAGFGRGLYTWTSQPRYYDNQACTKWSWRFLNASVITGDPSVFIYAAEFDYLNTVHDSNAAQIGLTDGIGNFKDQATTWSGWTDYSRLLCAEPDCRTNPTLTPNNQALLRTVISPAGTRQSFQTYMGGALIYLNDLVAPVAKVSSRTPQPTGWVDAVSPGLVIEGTDLQYGIGIKQFKVAFAGALGTKYRTASCTGDRNSRCVWNSKPSDGGDVSGDSFDYNTADLPEGTNTLSAQVMDVVGNWSNPETWQVKVDHSPPSLTLGGELWNHRGETLDHGVYGLVIESRDYVSQGTLSGVKSVEVQVDGQRDYYREDEGCDANTGCPGFASDLYRFVTAAHLPGEHTITVIAKDALGHSRTESFTVTVDYSTACPRAFADTAYLPPQSVSAHCAAWPLGQQERTPSIWTAQLKAGAPWPAGTTWPARALYGVSCASVTSCVAIGQTGEAWTTTNGGLTWTPASTGAGLRGVSCPTSAKCWAVGGRKILATTNGGASWSVQREFPRRFPSGEDLRDVSCPSTTHCWVVDWVWGEIFASSDGGLSWSLQYDGTRFESISCPTTSACVATGDGGAVAVTADGGASWTTPGSGTTNNLLGVSCPTASVCWAVGEGPTALRSANGGTTWAAQDPGSAMTLKDVSCPTTSACWAVGGNGINSSTTVVGTTNGGATWEEDVAETGVDLNGVSCPTVQNCWAVGYRSTLVAKHDPPNTGQLP